MVTSVQVSWVRHKDIHLLTVGRYTYTSDQRFESVHSPHTEDWTLRIRYPQKEDSGTYECQISTTPPIGHPVYLSIVGEYSTYGVKIESVLRYVKNIVVCVSWTEVKTGKESIMKISIFYGIQVYLHLCHPLRACIIVVFISKSLFKRLYIQRIDME